MGIWGSVELNLSRMDAILDQGNALWCQAMGFDYSQLMTGS
jgi:hypothetical protein